ncbi:MAG: hypothetical protein AAFO69_01535 [Bacteroidota bacterium]
MNKLLKPTIVILLVLFAQTSVFAQDEEVTDEELTAYATLLLQIDSMKLAAKTQFSEMVKTHELMDGGRRYNALKKAIGDEAKLAEIEATEEEIAAYEELVAKNGEASANIKSFLSTNVKDGIGARKYNVIKKKLKADSDFKAKYEEIVASLKEKMEEATVEETN